MHSQSIDSIDTNTSIGFIMTIMLLMNLKKRTFTHYYDFDTIFSKKKSKKLKIMKNRSTLYFFIFKEIINKIGIDFWRKKKQLSFYQWCRDHLIWCRDQ